MAEKKEIIKEKEHNVYEISFRVAQAIFIGIFALGLSSGLGDYATFVKSPLSSFSITSSVFGLMGMVATEAMARISKKW